MVCITVIHIHTSLDTPNIFNDMELGYTAFLSSYKKRHIEMWEINTLLENVIQNGYE